MAAMLAQHGAALKDRAAVEGMSTGRWVFLTRSQRVMLPLACPSNMACYGLWLVGLRSSSASPDGAQRVHRGGQVPGGQRMADRSEVVRR